MKLWGVHVLRPALDAACGRSTGSLYLLRHSHASACHYVASFTNPEAARRMGHGPGLHAEIYAHVIDTTTGTRHADLDALIAAARTKLPAYEAALAERAGSAGAADRQVPSRPASGPAPAAAVPETLRAPGGRPRHGGRRGNEDGPRAAGKSLRR